jgi:hypothetical protein
MWEARLEGDWPWCGGGPCCLSLSLKDLSCPCVTFARAMLKDVGCLPMVKPDAASHLGIRHVHP